MEFPIELGVIKPFLSLLKNNQSQCSMHLMQLVATDVLVNAYYDVPCASCPSWKLETERCVQTSSGHLQEQRPLPSGQGTRAPQSEMWGSNKLECINLFDCCLWPYSWISMVEEVSFTVALYSCLIKPPEVRFDLSHTWRTDAAILERLMRVTWSSTNVQLRKSAKRLWY